MARCAQELGKPTAAGTIARDLLALAGLTSAQKRTNGNGGTVGTLHTIPRAN